MLDYGSPVATHDAERAVIRDVWVFTALLFAMLAIVGFALSGALSMVGLVLCICAAGGAGITWVVHIEFESARQADRAPRISRIFD